MLYIGPELGPEAFCLWLLCVFIASIACHIGGLCMMSTLGWLEWCLLPDLIDLGSRSNNERQQGFKGGTGGQSPSWRTMIRTGYGPVGLRHPRVAETIKPAGSNEKKEAGTARGLANPASRSLFFFLMHFSSLFQCLLILLFRGEDFQEMAGEES